MCYGFMKWFSTRARNKDNNIPLWNPFIEDKIKPPVTLYTTECNQKDHIS